MWRPNLEYIRQRPALLRGWGRSFNQKSCDHRGTIEQPGRVLTLRQNPAHVCRGIAFEVGQGEWAETLRYLDHREKGGYTRTTVTLEMERDMVPAVSYIAHPGNPHDADDETVEQIVEIVGVAKGPSGTNREYLLALMHALEQHRIKDPYLDSVLAAFQVLDP